MKTIHDPLQTVATLEAIQAIEAGNNGHATIPNNPEIHSILEASGYTVTIRNGTARGYTKRAQQALASEPFAVDSAKRGKRAVEMPDIELAILKREEHLAPS